jgi:hypothetical protein
MVVATWLFAEEAGKESYYHQMRGNPSSTRFQLVYWRCVAVFFATLARTNPKHKRVLFTNGPTTSGDQSIDRLLKTLDVEIRCLQFTYEPPVDYYRSWRNQFFLFDIIECLANDAVVEVSLVLDSDCVFTNALGGLETVTRKSTVAPYAIAYPADFVANGLTRHDLGRLFSDFGHPASSLPTYCGGEIVSATHEGLTEIAEELQDLFPKMMARFKNGRPTFHTESQALSYVYHVRGYPIGAANPHIRRIWTGLPFRYHNDTPSDLGLDIWHLPAEKSRGLNRLCRQACDPESTFWGIAPGEPWGRFLARELGVGQRRFKKTVLDLSAELLSRVS